MNIRDAIIPLRDRVGSTRNVSFRTRVILAATVGVVFAVAVASTGAYLASRNSLINSVDSTLQSAAQTATASRLTPQSISQIEGLTVQEVTSSGTLLTAQVLPVNSEVLAVASGKSPSSFINVNVKGQDLREYVTHVTFENELGLFAPGALQLATPLHGVNQQLGNLGLALTLVGIAGVILAVLLGWLVARAAVSPLNDLTALVERLAQTTDVSERLEPGGNDELGRLRRAFNQLLQALELSRESQRQLVLDAAHELRTPLTSLRTNLEVVRRVEELPVADRELLVGDVLTQMAELTNLVGDLAELTRGDHAEQEAEPIRLDQLVEEAVGFAASHGRPRGVSFETSLTPTWVYGRPDRIARAVGNLLDNALKWSPDGGTVEVSCEDGVVRVRDHGPGISPSDLPYVFDRFYRAPAARGLPGSGLGLAIVAQVAQDQGGSVTADTAQDGGAVMELHLPVMSEPATAPTGD